MGDGIYKSQSFGHVRLHVDVRSDLGWRRMRSRSTRFTLRGDFDAQAAYMTAASQLFRSHEVDFSAYSHVLVVAAKNPSPGFDLSPAFVAPPDWAVSSPSGDISLGVTLGNDSYTNIGNDNYQSSFMLLAHELGLTFGIPDQYPYHSTNAELDSLAGCWSIMSDITHATGFLGWDRHKMGWLGSQQMLYVNEPGSVYATINPFSAGACGLGMIVVPIDDPDDPSRVFVVEVAQPPLGLDGTHPGEGVLVYVVDAQRAQKASPVKVIPKDEHALPTTTGSTAHCTAPYQVGDALHEEGPMSFSLQVLQQFNESYNVKVTYHHV